MVCEKLLVVINLQYLDFCLYFCIEACEDFDSEHVILPLFAP